MATTILTCSIPSDLALFLEETPEVSPSKVLQAGLYALRDQEARLKEKMKAQEIRLGNWINKFHAVTSWAEENGITIPDDVLAK